MNVSLNLYPHIEIKYLLTSVQKKNFLISTEKNLFSSSKMQTSSHMEDSTKSRSSSPNHCATHICICGQSTSVKGGVQPSPIAFLFANTEFADITLRLADNTDLPAHTMVLCTWSSVFATMLLGNGLFFKDGKSKVIVCDTHPPSTVRISVKVLYSLPQYTHGTISYTEAFDVFDFALKYSITPIQNICVAEITKMLSDTGNSMQMVDGIKYVEIVRNVFNRWIFLYDEQVAPPETLKILEELVSQVMRTIKDNLEPWFYKDLWSPFLNGLTISSMKFLLNCDYMDLPEIKLIELYLVWIKHRYGTFTRNEDGKGLLVIPSGNMAAKDDEVELLESIRWGNISTDDIIKLYNTLAAKNLDNSCIPEKVSNKFKSIMLESVLHKNNTGQPITSIYTCSSSQQKRSRRTNQSSRKRSRPQRQDDSSQ